jgi:hypothetical protein
MLVIRREQFDALAAVKLANFETRMIQHLRNVFPEWSLALGPEKLHDFVRHGIARASVHGFRTELDVARYLHVMQSLGETFDESTEFPWAAELLTKEIPAAAKMDRLRDAVEYQLEARRICHVR